MANQFYYTRGTSNSTSSSTSGYYTINYGNYYSNYNSYMGSYTPKTKQQYKNKEVKYLLQKERGW